MEWNRMCDTGVAEVSSPSHGVGYEIAYALSLGKPVLCCYKDGKRISKIITGNTSPGLTVASYEDDEQAVSVVRDYTRLLEEKSRCK
jgi:nucleoside 2-deoxyribosyltransferase